jgi:hypothetical protein
MDKPEFRFSSKKEYEIEIARILQVLQSARSDKKMAREAKKLESKYDTLVEEYLNFCSNGEPKNG